MNDSISRRAAIDAVIQAVDEWDGLYPQDRNMRIRNAIYNLPSAQPERKKGEWLAKWSGDGEVLLAEICSECGTVIEDDIPTGFNFCPNCGADMREE